MVNWVAFLHVVATASVVALATASPAAQAGDGWDCGVYRQDRVNATGRMMRIPKTDEERATLYFDEDETVRITDTDGVTKSYETSSGGRRIRSGVLKEIGSSGGEVLWYADYSLEHIRPDVPNHFIILQGDIYWPDCP